MIPSLLNIEVIRELYLITLFIYVTLYKPGLRVLSALMSSRAIFDPKLLGETQVLSFDFTSELAIGETINSQTVVATTYSGTDASPSSIISGSASSSGAVVSQKVTGGVLGVMYELLCTITTSLGQTQQQSGFLAVVPDLI